MKRASQIASEADAAVVCVGLTDEYDTEFFDRENMDLPGAQDELIEAVARANPNTIVVIISGSPVSMTGWIDLVPAVIEAGYLGQECGNAIAGVLFGQVNPSGRLSETFPKRLEDNPAFINYPGESGQVLYGEGIFVGYRYYDKKLIEPLFPFGHGLSYTSFAYDNLRLSAPDLNPGEKLLASIDVKNTGDREGREVVQLYIRDAESSLVRPPKELKGFQKINLKPGETKTIHFEVDETALSFYSPAEQRWVAEPGEFEILIGSSSRDIRAAGSFILNG